MNLQIQTIKKLAQLINEETEYRSGPELVEFFNGLGFNDTYGQGFPSRRQYTEEKLNKLNGTDIIKECIIQLFSPINFIGRYNELENHLNDFNQYLSFDNYKISRTNRNINIQSSNEEDELQAIDVNEDDFLKKEFKDISIDSLCFDGSIKNVIIQRIEEIQKCIRANAPLAAIFLSGSTLEGLLFGIASRHQMIFNQSDKSPKEKTGKVKQHRDWSLNDFIEVAYTEGYIREDVRKFSHYLRDFRNYIHPREQVDSNFHPDNYTANICWQVLKAAISQISEYEATI